MIQTGFADYLDRIIRHEDFDMGFLAVSQQDFDIQWLVEQFNSAYADDPDYNFAQFKNASFDALCDQLLHSIDYKDVYDAAIEMQKILTYQVPYLVCYENIWYYVYRTDRFEGFFNDTLYGPACVMNNLNVHLKSGVGGTFRIGITTLVNDFNFMRMDIGQNRAILANMYDPLMRRDADGKLKNWLAKTITIETHADNPDVPSGHTRINIEILHNITWNTGNPLTASDVAFSLMYYKNGTNNWYGAALNDLITANATSNYTLYVEFDGESYWYLEAIATRYIIPESVFGTTNPDDWNKWDPDPHTDFSMISGPFRMVDNGTDYVKLVRNPYYFKETIDPVTLVGPAEMYVAEDTPFKVKWDVLGLPAILYDIYINDSLVASDTGEFSSITYSQAGLNAGTYNITVRAEDLRENINRDTVIVKVIADPTIQGKTKMNFTEGTTGNNITWTVSGEHLANYTITINGTQVAGGTITKPGNITVNVDDLPAGVYNVTLTVINDVGSETSHTVIVTVRPRSRVYLTNITLLLIIGALVVIVSIGCVISRSRGP